MADKNEEIEKQILSQIEKRKEENKALKRLLMELDKNSIKKNLKIKNTKP